MWSTKPLKERKINTIILSGESTTFFNLNNEKRIKSGLIPSVTQDRESSERLTHHLYLK